MNANDGTTNASSTVTPQRPSLAPEEIETLRRQKQLVDAGKQEQETFEKHLENLSDFLQHLSEERQQDFLHRSLQSMEAQNRFMQDRQDRLVNQTVVPAEGLMPDDLSRKIYNLFDLTSSYLQNDQVKVQKEQVATVKAYLEPKWLKEEIEGLKGHITSNQQLRDQCRVFEFKKKEQLNNSIRNLQAELELKQKILDELTNELNKLMKPSIPVMVALGRTAIEVKNSYERQHSVTAQQLTALHAAQARNLQEQIRLEDALNKRILQMQGSTADPQVESDTLRKALRSLDKHIASHPDANKLQKEQPDKLQQMKLAETRLAELDMLQKWQELQQQRLSDLCQLISIAPDTTPSSERNFSLDAKATENAKRIIPLLIATLKKSSQPPILMTYKDVGDSKTNYPNLSATTVFDDVITGKAYLLVEGGQGHGPGQRGKPQPSATLICIDRQFLVNANLIAFGSKVAGSIKAGKVAISSPAPRNDKGRTSPGR